MQESGPRESPGTSPPEIRTQLALEDGTVVTLRTIHVEDAEIEQKFVRHLSPDSRRHRFLSAVRELTPHALARFVQPEFPEEMALIATIVEDGREKEIGVARYAGSLDTGSAEFAIVVADQWQGRGIGSALLRALFGVAESAGMRTIEGVVLRENRGMLRLMSGFGFRILAHPEDPTLVCVRSALPPVAPA